MIGGRGNYKKSWRRTVARSRDRVNKKTGKGEGEQAEVSKTKSNQAVDSLLKLTLVVATTGSFLLLAFEREPVT